jgi:hypothetical protein
MVRICVTTAIGSIRVDQLQQVPPVLLGNVGKLDPNLLFPYVAVNHTLGRDPGRIGPWLEVNLDFALKWRAPFGLQDQRCCSQQRPFHLSGLAAAAEFDRELVCFPGF